MPLRDHFHPPLIDYGWDTLHGIWPGKMAEQLNQHLPPQFRAGPNVHLGRFEIDIGVKERHQPREWSDSYGSEVNGGGTALLAEAEPTSQLDFESNDADEYEIKVFRGWELVAAIELISPSNLDRPSTRDDFVTKCAALLRNEICVTIVDIVTDPRMNLYAELLAELGWPGPPIEDPIYAVTLHSRTKRPRHRVDAWYRPLEIGSALPTLPIWISPTQTVPLELELTYEAACRGVRLP